MFLLFRRLSTRKISFSLKAAAGSCRLPLSFDWVGTNCICRPPRFYKFEFTRLLVLLVQRSVARIMLTFIARCEIPRLT